jgi:hypothetical protein
MKPDWEILISSGATPEVSFGNALNADPLCNLQRGSGGGASFLRVGSIRVAPLGSSVKKRIFGPGE